MQILSQNELLNISGGTISTLPNFEAYAKLFKFIFNWFKSWF